MWFFVVLYEEIGDFRLSVSCLLFWSLRLGVCVCGEGVGGDRGGTEREWVKSIRVRIGRVGFFFWVGSFSFNFLGFGYCGMGGDF